MKKAVTLPPAYLQTESWKPAVQRCVEDSAPADIADNIELICHDAGKYGSFTKSQKLDAICHIIADEEEMFSSTKPVFLNQACIFKYEYPSVTKLLSKMLYK